MSNYLEQVQSLTSSKTSNGVAWGGINPEYAARMRLQNRFLTGLDIARYTASIMRTDMQNYDGDTTQYTQSLGCWHGFTAQQMLMA
ncbi:MAG: isocitrate lyase, partial [Pseudomonadota bacterium]|nr:isocitrate lyase [Pseudomonadota bacterium]